jgi:hypothetical protein
MKEKLNGAAYLLAKRNNSQNTEKLFALQQEKFENKNRITENGNKIWRLECESLSLSQRNARIEKETQAVFISMGMKVIKDETKQKEKKDDGDMQT